MVSLTEEVKHSGYSFTGGKIHTRATRASDGADSKEGRAFVQDFWARISSCNSSREATKKHSLELLVICFGKST
jgi:hypothetical protein